MAGVIVLAVYLRTLAPAVFMLDSPELTAAAYSLGIVHAPGYPVYMLVGHLFLKLPLGDAGWQMNLFSGLAAAATVALIAWLVQRMAVSLWDETGAWLAGLVAGLCYGLCFYVWSMAVVAEVYAFQGLAMVLVVALLLQWRSGGRRSVLASATFVTGLATANSPVAVLWWPGFLLLALATDRRKQLRPIDFVLLAIALAAGLAFVLYLPLRSLANPGFVYVGSYDAAGRFQPLNLADPAGLLWFLSGRQFSWLMAAFLGVGLPLGLWGLGMVWRRERGLAAGLFLAALPYALFLVTYGAPDKDMMFVPFFAVWAALLGLGLVSLVRVAPRRVAPLSLLLPVALFLVNLPYADVSRMSEPHDRSVSRLVHATPGALYLAHWGDASAMEYQQLVHGLRTDVQVLNVFFITPDNLATLIDDSLRSGRAVYATYRQGLPVERFYTAPHGGDYQLFEYRRYPWRRFPEQSAPWSS